MVRSRFCKLGIALAFAFAAGLLVGTAAERPLRVLVDGKDVEMRVPPQLVDGEVVAPVAPVARAVGAEVAWNEQARWLNIRSRRHWITVDRPSVAGTVRPYDFRAFGPILALRHYLSEVQWESLNQAPDSPEPVLARFEIIDALSWSMFAMPGGDTPTKAMGKSGFRLRAILYWVTLDREGGYPRGASRLITPLPLPPGAVEKSPELQAIERGLKARLEEMVRRCKDPSGTVRQYFETADDDRGLQYNSKTGFGRSSGIAQWGPWPREVSIETMDYVLNPEGVLGPREVQGHYGPLKEVVQGTSGWVVDDARIQQIAAQTISIGDYNHVVPLYDISVQRFPAAPPPPHADPLALPLCNTHCRW